MAFVLNEKGTIKWPVKVDRPTGIGKHSVETFTGEFKWVTQTRLKEIGKSIDESSISEMELISEILVGWEAVNDEDGNSIKFTKANVKKLVDTPLVAGAIARAFFEALGGGKRKN